MSALEIRVQKSLLLGLVVATLAIAPQFLIDSINLPKLLVIAVCGFGLAGLLVSVRRELVFRVGGPLVIGLLAFAVVVLAVFFAGGASWSQLFGAWGRNTGLLSYLSLSAILLGAAYVSRAAFGLKVLAALVLVGGINGIYGFIQWRGWDPINWVNPYSPIVGTLGNPNFTSALLGLAASAGLALLFGKVSVRVRLLLVFLVVLMVAIAYESDAIQGVVVFLIGAAIVFYARFLRTGNVALRYSYLLAAVVGGVVSVLGTLQKGPLASILYQDSVTYRGDYWRAGWKMTVENPILGVGMDKYGEWYRASRTLAATERRGPEVTANSAHNVFLDISSNGGFPLLLAYGFLILLALRAGVRILRRKSEYDPIGVGLFVAWVGYMSQSLISINQLGLAIWGWALTGALIGYDRYTAVEEKSEKNRDKKFIALTPAAIMLGFVGLLVGFFAGIGPVVKDAAFANAIKGADGNKVRAAAMQWPKDSYYFDFLALVFKENQMNKESIDQARLSVELNPRGFKAWELIYGNPEASESEKAEALARMKELDPNNPTYKDK